MSENPTEIESTQTPEPAVDTAAAEPTPSAGAEDTAKPADAPVSVSEYSTALI